MADPIRPTEGAPSGAPAVTAPAAPVAAAPPAPAATAPSSEAFDFQKWYEAQPKEAIEEFGNRHAAYINNVLEQQYGDILPAVIEVAKDPDLRKRLARLKNHDEAAFALQNALDIYDREVAPRAGQPADAAPDPAQARVDALEAKIKERDDREQTERYISRRVADKDALLAEHPELAWKDENDPNYRKVALAIESAHALSIQRGRFVSVIELLDGERGLGLPPPAAPATSRAEVGLERPQAPKTAAEAGDSMLRKLEKAGGFRNLASATSRVRR